MSTPSHMAIAGNELVLIETVPLGALVNRIIRHAVTRCRHSEQRVGRDMHIPLPNTFEHKVCGTQWHIKYQVAFKLNMVTTSFDSIMTTTDYHTLTNS